MEISQTDHYFFEGGPGGQFPKTKHSCTAKTAAMGKKISSKFFLLSRARFSKAPKTFRARKGIFS